MRDSARWRDSAKFELAGNKMNQIRWMAIACSLLAGSIAHADDLQSWGAWENPPAAGSTPPWSQGLDLDVDGSDFDGGTTSELSYVETDANDPGGVYSRGIGPLLNLGLSPTDLANALNDVATTVGDTIDNAVGIVIGNLPP